MIKSISLTDPNNIFSWVRNIFMLSIILQIERTSLIIIKALFLKAHSKTAFFNFLGPHDVVGRKRFKFIIHTINIWWSLQIRLFVTSFHGLLPIKFHKMLFRNSSYHKIMQNIIETFEEKTAITYFSSFSQIQI